MIWCILTVVSLFFEGLRLVFFAVYTSRGECFFCGKSESFLEKKSDENHKKYRFKMKTIVYKTKQKIAEKICKKPYMRAKILNSAPAEIKKMKKISASVSLGVFFAKTNFFR